MPPKRLAVFTDAPELWGAEHSLVDLMSRAEEHGFDATIFAPAASPIHRHPRLQSRTSVISLPPHPALERGGIRHATPKDLLGEVSVRREGVRVISDALKGQDLALSFRLWRNEEVISAAHRQGLPAAVDLHETFEGRFGRVLSRVTLRRADAVIAPSMSVANSGGAPSQRLSVVPRAVAFDSPPQTTRPADKLVIGLFGQLREHKGHALVLEAVARAASDIPIELVVAGKGGDKHTQELVRRAAANTPTLVRFLPPIDNPLILMAGCHVVVNASAHEAFGRTVIEALAAGCLPIVTGTGPAEIVRDSGVGLITSARTVEALAERFVEVWKNRSILESARAVGPTVARDHYSLDTVAERYFGVLSDTYTRLERPSKSS